MYLNSLLDAAGLEVERDGVDASVRLFEDVSMDVPSPIPGLRNYQPVSYTHLDVYKRQRYQRAFKPAAGLCAAYHGGAGVSGGVSGSV